MRRLRAAVLVLVVSLQGVADDAPAKSPAARRRIEALKQTYHYDPQVASPTSALEAGPGVIVLPKFRVRSKKLPKFSEDEMLTDSGLEELLRKRYPGQSFGGQAARHGHTPNYAALSHHDDVRLAEKQDLDDTVATLRKTGRSADAAKLQRAMYDTFIRNLTPLEQAMDHSLNARVLGDRK